jgi:hypothetical protein
MAGTKVILMRTDPRVVLDHGADSTGRRIRSTLWTSEQIRAFVSVLRETNRETERLAAELTTAAEQLDELFRVNPTS